LISSSSDENNFKIPRPAFDSAENLHQNYTN